MPSRPVKIVDLENAGADPVTLMRARVRGTNINETTLLANDYLNHFSEFVMLLELVAEAPDLMAQARDWRPRTYEAHFRESGFAERELAIAAYALSPPEYRHLFDATVRRINAMIARFWGLYDRHAPAGDHERLAGEAARTARAIRRLVDVAGAIANGNGGSARQQTVDDILTG